MEFSVLIGLKWEGIQYCWTLNGQCAHEDTPVCFEMTVPDGGRPTPARLHHSLSMTGTFREPLCCVPAKNNQQ